MKSNRLLFFALAFCAITLLTANVVFAKRLVFDMREFYPSDKQSMRAMKDLSGSMQPMDTATSRIGKGRETSGDNDVRAYKRQKTQREAGREAIQDEEEALYKANGRNRLIVEREMEKITDKDLQAILRIHFFATHDYAAEVAWIDEYLKKPESASQLKETIKSSVFASIKTIPFPDYIKAIDDEKLKESASSLYQVFCEIRDDTIETPGWRIHLKDWKDLEAEFESTITTTGIPELKLPALRDIRCQLVRLYSWRISEINYRHYYVETWRKNRLVPMLVSPEESERERVYIANSMTKYEADTEKIISSKLLLQSDIQLVQKLRASVRKMAEIPGVFPIDEYYDFLQSYSAVPAVDQKLAPETNAFIAAFDDAWFKNGVLALKVRSALERCDYDLKRRTPARKQ